MKLIKTIVIVTIILISILLLMIIFNPFNRKPKSKYIIYVGYYICEKCQSIEGGIYGKGPIKVLHNKKSNWCIHKWEEINKKEFKELATKWFKIDWGKEIPFWNSDK